MQIKSVFIIAVLSILSLQSFGQWNGAGSQESPYQIYSRQDLRILADSCQDCRNPKYEGIYFKLMNDITDSVDFSLACFNGIFNGSGHFININIDNSSIGDYNYFFSVLRPTGHIDSLVLNGNSMAWTGLVLDNYGIISNCVNNIPLTNIISGAVYGISGICSESRGIIDNCVNNADIYYFSDELGISFGAAGICLISSYPGEIKNCVNNGNIYATSSSALVYIAGITAYRNNSFGIDFCNLTNCTNNGNIEVLGDAPWAIAGGICASLELCLSDTIGNCVNNGNISGKGIQYAGGVVGLILLGGESGAITCLNCINTGNISGKISTGGIVGISSFSCRVTLKNCLNSGIIEGDGVEGGFIGDINRIYTEPSSDSFVFENNRATASNFGIQQ